MLPAATSSISFPSPRQAWLPFVASCLIPGLGQCLNGRFARAIGCGLLVLGVAFAGSFLVPVSWAGFVASLVFSFIAIVCVAFDAGFRNSEVSPTSRSSRLYLIALGYAVSFVFVSEGLRRWNGAAAFPVYDDSMSPVLVPGDQVMVDRSAYTRKLPAVGDIIAYRVAGAGLKMERVIAVPGDTVELVNETLLVNDLPLDTQTPISEAMYHQGEDAEYPETIVPDGHVFVLPDVRERMRMESAFVSHSAIIGRVNYVFASMPEGIGSPDLDRVGLAVH